MREKLTYLVVRQTLDNPNDPQDPRVEKQLLDYDARGNLSHIERAINNPEQPMDESRESVRKFVWDEEDRLLVVDLRPETDFYQPHIATYVYDASGERRSRFVYRQIKSSYSTTSFEDEFSLDLDAFLYPNAYLTARIHTIPSFIPPTSVPSEGMYTTYTKHYYIGSERVCSKIGWYSGLGMLCTSSISADASLIEEMNTRTVAFNNRSSLLFESLDKAYYLYAPYYYNTSHQLQCDYYLDVPQEYDAYWYHPDHLGSSSFITNTTGEISQHMEYLPFGETLVEEHLNSYNSPFKFNAKEYDAETGNYYYGARYLNPKWSIWLGVDPLYEMYPEISPYSYVLNNPIRYIDSTGMAVENKDCGVGCGIRKVFNKIFFPKEKQNPDGTLSSKTSRGTGWELSKLDKKTKVNNKPANKKPKQSSVSSLNQIGVVLEAFIPQVDVKLSNLSSINRSSIRFDNREISIIGPQSIDFNFSTIGGTASRSTDGIRTGTNHILPLTNSQQQNLQAIANYLIANPQATIRFQYPTPPNSSHFNFKADLREVYQMNFSQMTNYLIKQGVTNPNRRILMNYGAGFDFIVNPGK